MLLLIGLVVTRGFLKSTTSTPPLAWPTDVPKSLIYKHESPFSIKVESPIKRFHFPEPRLYKMPDLLSKSPFSKRSEPEDAKPSKWATKRGEFDWNLARDMSVPAYGSLQIHPYELSTNSRAEKRMKRWDVVDMHGPAMPAGFIGYVYSLD
ncbi:MAG: uncharacterized protein KVP18_000593 [Porospora cf. gigantea A]|uniref:uncharacterized protein n=1 Tax=Porospora cf. gigantea A TaxID=2853593 RepID=UPI003559389A|nr:MAG: hypothetical protein KVP18_000593 [Porospora cf. gigantea A]